jgi:haloacid dehalogenase superfamily, subfamily IA, variant 3 with third motif having DD or ED
MTSKIELVLFDIGGVLGSNGWDREQRAAAIEKFGLDAEDFQYRHEETVAALEVGMMTLDEYLTITAYCGDRTVSCAALKSFVFSQSEPWPDSIAVARDVASTGARMATLNNESEELNNHRIRLFGLREIFPCFFSSCWLRVRKPMHEIYDIVLGITQVDPTRTLFVDDRLQNLAPAAALGMHTIHFRSAAQLRQDLQAHGVLP